MIEDQGKVIAGRYQLQNPVSRFQPYPSGRPESSMASGADDQRSVPWQALDLNLHRRVFVKFHAADETKEFARAHCALWHALSRAGPPGMPVILDTGEEEARAFLVTEWLDAVSLHELEKQVQRVGGDVQAIIGTVLGQLLETLAALHEAGLTHGDISPHNILISKLGDRVWLVDPAPTLPGDKQLTTFRWAAPEFINSGERSPASDLYSLGSVLQAFAKRTGYLAPSIVGLMTRDNPDARPESATAARVALRRTTLLKSDPFPWSGGSSGSPLVGTAAQGWDRMEEPSDSDNWSARTVFQRPSQGEPMAPPQPFAPNSVPSPWTEYGVQSNADAAKVDGWSSRTAIGDVPIVSRDSTEPTDADFIVMGPTIVSRAQSFPLELWMGPSANAEELRERAQERGILSDRGGRSRVLLPSHTIITAIMSLPGFEVANPTEQMAWDGTIRNTAFIVHSTDNQKAGDYWGLVKLMVGSVPLGMVSFCVTIGTGSEVRADEPSKRNEPMQRFQTAFASYAGTDRSEVFKRLQAIRASQVDIYVDIVDLRGGERWEEALMREIAARDVFYLFWSQEAARSSWVEREWRQALNKRGLDFICPIPLEDPRFAEPPAELADLHFNDWCLAIIRGEQVIAEAKPRSI